MADGNSTKGARAGVRLGLECCDTSDDLTDDIGCVPKLDGDDDEVDGFDGCGVAAGDT